MSVNLWLFFSSREVDYWIETIGVIFISFIGRGGAGGTGGTRRSSSDTLKLRFSSFRFNFRFSRLSSRTSCLSCLHSWTWLRRSLPSLKLGRGNVSETKKLATTKPIVSVRINGKIRLKKTPNFIHHLLFFTAKLRSRAELLLAERPFIRGG